LWRRPVERKLTEMLGDPDKGRTLRSTVERPAFAAACRATRRGERGVPAAEVAKELWAQVVSSPYQVEFRPESLTPAGHQPMIVPPLQPSEPPRSSGSGLPLESSKIIVAPHLSL